MELYLWTLTAAALATGLVAGVFLSFSDFLMRSLRYAPPQAGVEAMQVINREVFRSVFIVLLLGMAPVSAAFVAAAYIWPPLAGQGWIALGGVTYLIGTLGVTVLGNVPKNERLAAMADGGPAAQAYWRAYDRGWTAWNHLRTASSAMAALSYLMAAMQIALAL